jgi:hypothetical protein
MTTRTEITQRNRRRTVRFFWGILIVATTVSLIGNSRVRYCRTFHASSSRSAPPLCLRSPALLVAVHGIALAVRGPRRARGERPAGCTAGRSALLPLSA